MAEHGPATGEADSSGTLWRAVRRFFLRSDGEQSLRAQLEEAIDEHEDDAGTAAGISGDLSPLERQMLRNLLHFSEHDADDVAIPRSATRTRQRFRTCRMMLTSSVRPVESCGLSDIAVTSWR